MIVALCGRVEFVANAQRRPAGPFDRIRLFDGPAPEPHGRIAVEIAHDASLLQNEAGRDPQRPADAIQQAEQIVGIALRPPREPAQIAEQHRHLGFARRQHLLRVLPGQGIEHDRREEGPQR